MRSVAGRGRLVKMPSRSAKAQPSTMVSASTGPSIQGPRSSRQVEGSGYRSDAPTASPAGSERTGPDPHESGDCGPEGGEDIAGEGVVEFPGDLHGAFGTVLDVARSAGAEVGLGTTADVGTA